MELEEIATLFPSPLKKGMVYQYTKWPALLGMIRTSKNGNPCTPYFVIRSYNASFMNDDDECRIGYQAFMDELKKRESYFGNKLTDRQTNIVERAKIINGQQRYYLSSYAAARDCLPMWQSYGGGGSGVAIGLDASILYAKGFPVISCIYDTPTIDRIVSELCDWAAKKRFQDLEEKEILLYNNYLYRLSCLAKNHHFEYEKEYRLCSYFENYIDKNKASFNNGTHIHDIHFECKGEKIVSYIEIEMPISVVKEIWIGPTNNVDSSLASLEMWLYSMNLMNHIIIHKSTAPFK